MFEVNNSWCVLHKAKNKKSFLLPFTNEIKAEEYSNNTLSAIFLYLRRYSYDSSIHCRPLLIVQVFRCKDPICVDVYLTSLHFLIIIKLSNFCALFWRIKQEINTQHITPRWEFYMSATSFRCAIRCHEIDGFIKLYDSVNNELCSE